MSKPSKKVTTAVILDEDLVAFYDGLAVSSDMSRSQVIRSVLRQYKEAQESA